MCPAHQADFVRVNVICDYGGIWLDSDTLVLEDKTEYEILNGNMPINYFIKKSIENKRYY